MQFKIPDTAKILENGMYFNSQKYFFQGTPTQLKNIGFKYDCLGEKMYFKKIPFYNIRIFPIEKFEIEIDNMENVTEMIDFILQNINNDSNF